MCTHVCALFQAPAAFGLVSFLLHEGFDRTRIRKHLAVFSVAAPLLSVITYFGLSQVCRYWYLKMILINAYSIIVDAFVVIWVKSEEIKINIDVLGFFGTTRK